MKQSDRSSRTRQALIESAARGLSRYGYGNLSLEQVSSDAGYTRGALYHQFNDKNELVRAVIEWTFERWQIDVGFNRSHLRTLDPADALLSVAHGHAVFCRRDVARLMIALRLEFSGQDHSLGTAIEQVYDTIVAEFATLIREGRETGSLPPGPPPHLVALALVGAVEGLVVAVAGKAPHDVILARRTAAGVLGLDQPAERTAAGPDT